MWTLRHGLKNISPHYKCIFHLRIHLTDLPASMLMRQTQVQHCGTVHNEPNVGNNHSHHPQRTTRQTWERSCAAVQKKTSSSTLYIGAGRFPKIHTVGNQVQNSLCTMLHLLCKTKQNKKNTRGVGRRSLDLNESFRTESSPCRAHERSGHLGGGRWGRARVKHPLDTCLHRSGFELGESVSALLIITANPGPPASQSMEMLITNTAPGPSTSP